MVEIYDFCESSCLRKSLESLVIFFSVLNFVPSIFPLFVPIVVGSFFPIVFYTCDKTRVFQPVTRFFPVKNFTRFTKFRT